MVPPFQSRNPARIGSCHPDESEDKTFFLSLMGSRDPFTLSEML